MKYSASNKSNVGKVVKMFPGIKQSSPDIEIIQLLKARNKEGISLLYDTYSPNMYGVIFNIVKNESDACAVLESVFSKIWILSEHTNFSNRKFQVWMLGIACREAAIKVGKTNGDLIGLIFQQGK